MAKEVTWTPDRPGITYSVTLQEKLADAPEWTCVQLDITFPPDASSPPHRHGGANVFALVAEGEILSGMNDGEAKVYKKGETWYEAPGCLHRVSDNASKSTPARLIATFIIKTEVLEREGPSILVQVEPEYMDKIDPEKTFKQV